MKAIPFKSAPLVAAVLAAGLVGGDGAEAFHHASVPAHAGVLPPLTPAETSRDLPTASGAPDFPLITQKYGPAVVNISVSATRKRTAAADSDDDDDSAPSDPFEFFKRFQQGHGQRQQQQRDMPVHGLASGFIVDPNGIILPNAHVVKDA